MRRTVLTLIVSAALVAGCGGGGATAQSSPSAVTASGVSAWDVVHGLARKWRVPNARENTPACKAAGCVQLVTTDTISVYQFAEPAAARKYATALGKNPAYVPVGVFVLSWAGQGLPASQTRARVVAEVKRIVQAG